MTAPCPAYGFRVGMELVSTLTPAARDILRDAWRALVEERGLYCEGGGSAERVEYVVASEASQATDGDRAAVRTWLASRTELRAWRVGELEDVAE